MLRGVPPRRLRRRALGLTALTLLGLAACAGSGVEGRAPSPSAPAPSVARADTGSITEAPGPPTTAAPPVASARPTDPVAAPDAPADPGSPMVATRQETFVDHGRGRTLVTTLYFPTTARTRAARSVGEAAADAPPGAAPGPQPLPLVLFAHGYLLPGDGYDRVMKAVAAAGYVVAAPELPHTTAHGGDGLRRDITNQPADLAFVADQVVAAGAAPGAAIPAIRDPQRIAVVGHSDGGLTATALGYGEQFRDPRVVAVVSLTGGVGLFPGPFFRASDPPALLAVHARDDATNPYTASTSLFRSVPPGRPRFLLSIERGGHIDPYMFGTGRPELGDAIAAFLDLVLGADPTATPRLQRAAAGPGLSLEAGA